MDPNVALAQIRGLIQQADDADNPFHASDLRLEALSTFETLDVWLKQGGFLPTDWERF